MERGGRLKPVSIIAVARVIGPTRCTPAIAVVRLTVNGSSPCCLGTRLLALPGRVFAAPLMKRVRVERMIDEYETLYVGLIDRAARSMPDTKFAA